MESRNNVAIIGFHGKFPKAGSPDLFWENLRIGRNCIEEIPKERWDLLAYSSTSENADGLTVNCKWGAFLDDIDKFDPKPFGISPKDAEEMDPQARLFLESVWSTLECAGYGNHRKDPRHRIGLYVGNTWHDYSLYVHEKGFLRNRYLGPGSLSWYIANQTSLLMNFRGPSMAVDSACASSLLAVHLACQSLHAGECDMSIAGGVHLAFLPFWYVWLTQEGILSASEKKSVFEPNSKGLLVGEAVGSLLLKRLEEAVKDGDQIFGVIRGSATGHVGKGELFDYPNPETLSDFFITSFNKARIDPRTLNYIEMQAYGSENADAAEFAGLCKAFRHFTQDRNFCAIGSLKPDLGHAGAASGVSQIIKVLLQFKHGELVPTKFSEEISTRIDLKDSPFFLQRELGEWTPLSLQTGGESEIIPRRAGIDSMGAGGSIVHLILEEYGKQVREPSLQIGAPKLIVLSAATVESLKAHAKQIGAFLEKVKAEEGDTGLNGFLSDMAYTLNVGREGMEERVAMVVSGMDELRAKLNQFVNGQEDAKDIYQGNAVSGKSISEFLFMGEEGKEYLKTVITDGNLKKLAQLWVNGIEIDWKSLYREPVPNRVCLPTYPFARDRFWISGDEPEINAGKRAPQATDANTLIQEEIRNYILRYLKEQMDLPMERIDPDGRIQDYGVNSIITVKFMNRLMKRYKIKITGREMLEYGTINSLSAYVTRKVTAGHAAGFTDEQVIDALEKLVQGRIDINIAQKIIEEKIQ
jgi:acyl transferase domain-containing protein